MLRFINRYTWHLVTVYYFIKAVWFYIKEVLPNARNMTKNNRAFFLCSLPHAVRSRLALMPDFHGLYYAADHIKSIDMQKFLSGTYLEMAQYADHFTRRAFSADGNACEWNIREEEAHNLLKAPTVIKIGNYAWIACNARLPENKSEALKMLDNIRKKFQVNTKREKFL